MFNESSRKKSDLLFRKTINQSYFFERNLFSRGYVQTLCTDMDPAIGGTISLVFMYHFSLNIMLPNVSTYFLSLLI